MIKIPYTQERFESEYFFYSGNSQPFSRNTLLREDPSYDQNLYLIRRFLNPNNGSQMIGEFERVFGKPSFIDDYSSSPYYIFEHNNDLFYFQIHAHDEGNSFGVLTDKNYKEKYPNHMFHPMECIWQNSTEMRNKFVGFMREIYHRLR